MLPEARYEDLSVTTMRCPDHRPRGQQVIIVSRVTMMDGVGLYDMRRRPAPR